jgi:hypothetical protein
MVPVDAFLDVYVSYTLADENEITAIVDCNAGPAGLYA